MTTLYYIETSNKRIYFKSQSLSELMLKQAEFPDTITAKNIDMYADLLIFLNSKYDWCGIRTESTPNGFFLDVSLFDYEGGCPEYKIYEV